MTDHHSQHPPDTRAALLSAAKHLFSRQGFHGTSVKEIAARAGVNISLVSYHFGGKEGIYIACLEDFSQERLAIAKGVLQPASTAEEMRIRLKLFLEEFFKFHIENSDHALILHKEEEVCMKLAPDKVKQIMGSAFKTIASFFEEAQKSGLLRKELDPMLVAGNFLGSSKSAAHADRFFALTFGKNLKDETHRKNIIDHILNITLYGCLTDRHQAPK